MPFDYTLDFKAINFRLQPELYKIGNGEQGVLLVEPYKTEILPYWKFKTPEVARRSAEKIFGLFKGYLAQKDFVGADMARKYLQMGYTRSRRYANHKSGRKYLTSPQLEKNKLLEIEARKNNLLPDNPDEEKALSAAMFKVKWEEAKQDPEYILLKEQHIEKYGK